MIYLNQGTNSVVVTLYERISQVAPWNNAQPYYTWQIVRKGTFDEVIFYQDDTSYAPWYWSEFQITVSTTYSSLTAGVIQANPGEWTYNIWQMTSPYNLSYTQSNNLVETGILIVNGTSSSNNEYDGNDDSTITYYKNI